MFAQKNFWLTDKEYNIIKEWANNHKCTCKQGGKPSRSCCGGEISITFTPTTVGTTKSARCICGEVLQLDNL